MSHFIERKKSRMILAL